MIENRNCMMPLNVTTNFHDFGLDGSGLSPTVLKSQIAKGLKSFAMPIFEVDIYSIAFLSNVSVDGPQNEKVAF